MVYSDTTNKLGILNSCEDYCELGDAGISGNATLLAQFTRHCNTTLSKIWAWIFFASFGSQYDDGGATDLPSAAQNLVTSTNKYALPSAALAVVGIAISDASGNWTDLKATSKDILQAEGTSLAEYGTDTGTPTSYIWTGNTIILNCISSIAVTNGFKVFFDRGSVAFASTDTTKTPGFASEFHNAVAVGASLEYLKVHKPNSAVLTMLQNDWLTYKQDIQRFYQMRFKNLLPSRMIPRVENNH